AERRRCRRRVLPHRGTLLAYLVRAEMSSRFWSRTQLRWIVDRVGQYRPWARRTRRRQERRLMSTPLPEELEDIVAEFDAVGDQERLQLLLELADELPELPSRYADHSELL